MGLKVKCPFCGDELHSMYRHDFQQCSCGFVFVDGGFDYERGGWDPKRGPFPKEMKHKHAAAKSS